MAPGQVPHHTRPWQDAQAVYLLSPLMGFLSRAWSLLRGPGPPEPWLVEAGRGAAEPHVLQSQNPQDEAEDSRAPQEGREAAAGPSLDLEACRLSCDHSGEYRTEAAARLQPGEFACGQPEPLYPGLRLRALQGPDKSPRDLRAEEGETKWAYLSSHSQGGPAREGQGEDAEAVNKEAAATAASASPLTRGLKPSTWLCCPAEEEERATEDRETENTEVRESPVSSPWSSSSPGAWQSCLGEAAEKGTEAREVSERGDADPEPWPSVPCLGLLLGPCDYQPREGAEKEENASCDSISAEGEVEAGDSSTPITNTFLGTWVYRLGEDTEEEEDDDDGDPGSAEEEKADPSPATHSTSTFLRAWVYRPREDTEEEEEEEEEDDDDRDLGSAEEGEADVSPATLGTSTFLRAWVYRPGEDTEEEEEEEDSDSGSTEDSGEASASGAAPSTLGNSTFLRAWVYRPEEDTEEEEEEEEDDDRDLGSAEEGEADVSPATLGTSTFLRAWVYRPGEDTEEEDEGEENQDTGSESGVAEGKADWCPSTSLPLQGVQPRAWKTAPSGDRVKEEHPAEAWAGAEAQPLAVAIYVPGQKPPAPWVAPKLPLRLQRRLKLSETLPQDQDPEAPTKGRKVRFSEKVTVHLLAVWAGPAQAARRGPWEQLARDRSRFARRIAQAEEKLGPCLTPAWRARAWARLGNPPGPTTPIPCSCQGPCPGSALDRSHGHALSLSSKVLL